MVYDSNEICSVVLKHGIISFSIFYKMKFGMFLALLGVCKGLCSNQLCLVSSSGDESRPLTYELFVV